MARQYVQVKLNEKSQKLYTYLNDEDADVEVGHEVEVPLISGATRLVPVEAVTDFRPDSVPSYINLKSCRRV